MRAWWGESEQAGSVAAASPTIASAWQRQPPQSRSLRSQERQGSGIQSVPRKAVKAGEEVQISARDRSCTDQKSRLGMVSAAWQGRTLPDGVTFMRRRPQPPAQAFG